MMKLVVLSCLLAAASASAAFFAAPIAYSAALIAPSNYRGPLSLAPGQPANILAADGRPLDTLDVNLDRSAHFTAKALEGGIHLLKKRSAPIIATPSLNGIAIGGPFLAPTPILSTRIAAAPLAATPLATASIVGSPLAAAPIALAASPYVHAL